MPIHPSSMPEPQSALPVAIIGGGITGLTAAWELQKAGLPYVLLEKSARVGGKIQTDRVDGFGDAPFIIERAGDAFLAVQKPWATELANELGLADEILTTNAVQPSVYIVKNGALIPIPPGLQLIIPTNQEAFLASPLMSVDGKARVLAEETIDPYRGDDDESVADFVRRRMGDEAVEMLAEPLLSGIYSAHPEEQSLLATFPRYRQLEQKAGSLIGGVRKAVAERRRDAAEKGERGKRETGDALTAFISFRGGTETLVRTLAAQLTGDLRLGVGVDAVAECDGGYALHLDSGELVEASQVLVTTPAAIAVQLLAKAAPAAAERLQKLRVVSTGIVFLAYRRAEIAHPLNGFGVVIPRSENRSLNAMTWMTTKFDHRAPADHVLLRLFFGGARTPQMMEKTDAEVITLARAELHELLGIDATPVLHRVYRWRDAQPQYDVGHLARMESIYANLPPGIHIAGSPYGGVGIPDCVRQGREVARQILDAS